MQEIYETILKAQAEHEDLVLATIIENVGSSPRTSGTKMLVRRDGSIVGTIGGGKLEADTIRTAMVVHENHQSQLFHFSLTGKDAAEMDMICGGHGDVLLNFLSGNDTVLKQVFEKTLQSVSADKKGWLIIQFDPENRESDAFGFIDESGNKTGSVSIDGKALEELTGTGDQIFIHSDVLRKANLIVEQIKKKKQLYVFGGGHVSLETVALANRVDFRTTVIDDRDEFANRERFPESEIVVVPSYLEVPELSIDAQTFIVIMTRGHLGDYDVLKKYIMSGAAYIGMIGSRHKRTLIYERLLKEGIPQSAIDRVHSPIGLSINGETPAEIAVSIVGELILERSRLK